MIDGRLLTEKLIKYAEYFLYLNPRDEIYFRNILLREFKIEDAYTGDEDLSYIEEFTVPDMLTAEIEQYAKENGLIAEGLENLFSTYIFGILSPLPSKVNATFNKIREKSGIVKACEYFYKLCVKNNYIQKTAISKNLKWQFNDGKKYLEITINLSKPEKDNKEIAKLVAPAVKKDVKYPACFLCKENEGFQGTATHPARENIRTISLSLGGEPWFVQYSPYAYFNEHLIAINEKHVPMHIAGDTIDKLFDFVDYFPNYMIGSNASLPIIGGSILNHEHFQGGEHLMPMHNAPLLSVFGGYKCTAHKKVKAGIVDWYNSVIRLESTNRKEITDCAKEIINAWADFSDEKCGIVAYTGDTRHNSLSPVVRKVKNTYIVDMILRNNLTSEEYPDGIFHAHPEYHNIKKEGIGLIEAMGLFILPGRLKKQLSMIADILCGKEEYDKASLSKKTNYLYVHKDMIDELMKGGLSDTYEQAMSRVTDKVNDVCKNILFNTAVFKKDDEGYKGFNRFLETVGIVRRK